MSARAIATGAGRPIRVLQFLTGFQLGGSERQVVRLTHGLSRSGFEVHLACLRKEGALLDEVADFPCEGFAIRSFRSPRAIAQQIRFFRHVRRIGFDVVHATGLHANIFAVPAARLAGVPAVIASIRDLGDPWTPLERRLQRIGCRFAHEIIVNAAAVRDRLVAEGYDRSRITVIHNAVGRSSAPDEGDPLYEEFGVPRDAPVVGIVARLVRVKGLEYFLEAASRLAPRFPEARFVLVGAPIPNSELRNGSSYEAELHHLIAARGLADRVVFAGDRKDVPRFLRRFRVGVLSSLSEGFPNALLESMAAGVPTVATRVGGCPEIIEDEVTGLLVPPADAAGLAAAIGRLLDSPELARRLGQAGQERVGRRFNDAALVDRTSARYRHLLGSRGRQPSRVQAPKVLLVGPCPPPHGGVAVHLANLRRRLQEYGMRCECFDPSSPAGSGRTAPVQAAVVARTILRFARRGWTIHVHINGHNTRSWLLALLAGAAARSAPGRLLTLHSGMLPDYLDDSGRRWRRHLARASCLRFDRAIAVSEPIRRSLTEAGVPRERMAVIPAWTGIDGPAARIPPGIESWIARHRPVIAATLAFRPEYRFEWQLAALAALRGEHPSLGLVVMGQGEGAGPARRQVRQQRLEDNVLLLGDVPHSRCLAILSRCDVFLRTTSREGDALSVREALALGIPVVASDVGHRPDGVRLFPADELAGLVRVLRGTLREAADTVVEAPAAARPADSIEHAPEAIARADLDRLLGAYREVSRGGAWMRRAPAVVAGPGGRP